MKCQWRTKYIKKIDNILAEYKITEIKQINRIFIFADGDLKNRIEKIESILDISFNQADFEFLVEDDLRKESPSISIGGSFEVGLDYFIFPDNESKGRLEDIILEAIELCQYDLLDIANNYIEQIEDSYKDSWGETNSKREKAKIGIIGNILLPGAANTTLIGSNKVSWLELDKRNIIQSLNKVYSFLEEKLI
ncbi:MAG: DUF3226 domain-containing protein [Sarcina sp.]